MIVTLRDTSSQEVDLKLLTLREEGGVVALGRVLTLIVLTSDDVETAIAAANDASREHPCRVIVINPSTEDTGSNLDAEVRVGADAGASEVVILTPSGPVSEDVDTLVTPLLLPDAPIVVWWPDDAPARLADGLLGALSQRRISDVLSSADPVARLRELAENYTPGDTDLSWARTTLWRALTASTLDISPSPAVSAVVHGNATHPSVLLYAGWLSHGLGVPIRVDHDENAAALTGLTLHQESGEVRLRRPQDSSTLSISIPGQVDQHVSLPLRGLAECLVEDLRRLDPDETFAAALNAIFNVELS